MPGAEVVPPPAANCYPVSAMASPDMMLGGKQPQKLPVGPNPPLANGLDHNLVIGKNHNSEYGQSNEHNTSLGQAYKHSSGLSQACNKETKLPQAHDCKADRASYISEKVVLTDPKANHNLVFVQNYGQSHEHDTGLRQAYEHGSGLGQGHDKETRLAQACDCKPDRTHGGNVYDKMLLTDREGNHNLAVENSEFSQSLEHNMALGVAYEHSACPLKACDTEVRLAQARDPEVDKADGYIYEDMLLMDPKDDNENNEYESSEEEYELATPENNELALIENELDGNMELGADQNDEMTLVPFDEMNLYHSQLELSTPVLQQRIVPNDPDYELHVGQEFPDVMSCRRALRDNAIALRFEIQTVKSDKTRFTAKCASEGCPWRIHAAKLPGVPSFTIRTINGDHTCGGIAHLGHQQASIEWVANSVEQCLRGNPNYKPKEILEEVYRSHGITLSYKQAWRGKERIMASMRGSFEEGYRILPEYCEQVKRTNPGSIANVYGNPTDNSFQSLFISFYASIDGFLKGCRPLIGLDRVYLKSKYLGILLLATGFDGEGALFPLAFGIVDEENEANWMWFLTELRTLFEIHAENMPRLTILSDRQKGIVEGVEANFVTAFHGFCMRHLRDSFRKGFNNTTLIGLFEEAAYALTEKEFDAKLFEIEEISQDAAYWIRRIPPRLWATAFFEGKRFGHMTANVVESLNNWLLEASGLPIVQMLESIRRQLMTWFNERRENSMQWQSILVPTAERQVIEANDRACTYQVLRANDAQFEITSHEGTNIVDIRNRNCGCKGWQLCGLPCAHAVATLLVCSQNVHRFTEPFFTVASYRKTYSQTIHPIPDKTTWKEFSEGDTSAVAVVINPPKSLRPPGRPRKKRVRAEDRGRVKRVVHCSRCNQTGHFRTTCAAPI